VLNSLPRPRATGWATTVDARLPAALGVLGIIGLLLYPTPVAWLGLAALLVAAALGWRYLGWSPRCSLFGLPLGLYLAGAVVGLLSTVSGPLFAEVRFFGLLAALATFYLSAQLATSAAAARRLVGGTLLATALSLPPVLLLVAPVLQDWYLPWPVPNIVALLVPIGTPLREAVLEVAQMGQRYRLYAAGLGALATFGVGLALGLAVAGGEPRIRRLGWAAVAYFACFVVLSANRGAALTALMLTLAVGSVCHRRLRLAGLAVVLGAVGLLLVRPYLTGLRPGEFWWEATSSYSVEQRREFWTNSLFLLGDFWFTGAGLGLRSVETVYRAYFLAFDPPFFHTHNIFVQSYLEQGLLGLLGLIGLVAAGAIVGWRALRRSREPAARAAAISAGSAALALVAAGFTEIVALTTVGMVLLFGMLGVLYGLSRLGAAPRASVAAPASSAPARRFARSARLLPIALAAILLLGALPVALNASLRLPLPVELKQPVRAAVARVHLNLGALELAKGTLSSSNQGRGGHLRRAEASFDQVENLDPDNPALARLRTSLALTRKQPAEAQEWLARAASATRADDRQLQFQLGRLYRAAGDGDQALTYWTRVGAEEQLLAWGAELLAERQPARAVSVYEAAIQAGPRIPGSYSELRLAAERAGGSSAALAAMHRMVEQYPTVPWPYLEIAEIHSRADQPSAAKEWYRQAAEIAPDDWRVQERLP
jgi:tetratricopeptide (TPR) repeat protein